MQGLKRRLVYLTLYEAIAILFTTVVLVSVGHGGQEATALSVLASAIALAWNGLFNLLFERWESRQQVRGRSLRRRAAHAIGFEGGLAVILVPTIAWWLQVSLYEALVLDFGLVLFFLVYTFAFSWCFDRIFGLPASAQ